MRCVYVLSDASKHCDAKLAPKYEGPFTIVKKNSPTVYILNSKERGSKCLTMVHVSELKRYVSPRRVNEKNDARLSVSGTTNRVNNEVELQDEGEGVTTGGRTLRSRKSSRYRPRARDHTPLASREGWRKTCPRRIQRDTCRHAQAVDPAPIRRRKMV